MAFFSEDFPLVATLQNFRKCAMTVSLPNLPYLGFAGTLGDAVCSKMLCYVCTLSALYLGGDHICARLIFVAFFSEDFPLVATLQNFRKCAMRVSLPNLPYLSFAGTLGDAVCSKMLCYVCTLS